MTISRRTARHRNSEVLLRAHTTRRHLEHAKAIWRCKSRLAHFRRKSSAFSILGASHQLFLCVTLNSLRLPGRQRQGCYFFSVHSGPLRFFYNTSLVVPQRSGAEMSL